jgi:hypothetical protein
MTPCPAPSAVPSWSPRGWTKPSMRAHGIVAKEPIWPEAAGTAQASASYIALAAILEVAVHKGFRVLDTVPHVLTTITVNPKAVFVLDPSAIPNPNWLRPGIPSDGQQTFGGDLLSRHKIVLIPSVVSTASWNLMFSRVKRRRRLSNEIASSVCSRSSPAPPNPSAGSIQ